MLCHLECPDIGNFFPSFLLQKYPTYFITVQDKNQPFSKEFHAVTVGFGDTDRNFGESGLQFLGQNCNNRVFCIEMSRINQGQSRLLSVSELVVFYVSGDKGVASGLDGLKPFTSTGTTAYGNPMDRLSSVGIPQPRAAQAVLNLGQKAVQ